MRFSPLQRLQSLLIHRCVSCGHRNIQPLCADCLKLGGVAKRTRAGLTVTSLGPHEGALSDFIHGLKYGQKTAYASHLAAALARRVGPLDPDLCLVPVPLHPLKLAQRGYNQSALIARVLGSTLGLRVRFDLLRRIENTDAQARLAASHRTENVARAFSGTGKDCSLGLVLVDDVATTGSTLDACARALSRKGLSVVSALTLALGGDEWTRVAPQFPTNQNTVKASPPSSRSAGRIRETQTWEER